MRDKLNALHIPLVLAALLLASACSKGDGGGGTEQRPLTIWWFEWPPAQGLQELGNEFEAQTGIPVKVQAIPLSSYQERVFLDFGNKETSFDIVIGDSQWIGRGATKGLYVDLTEWLPTVVELANIHPTAARYLCEYPPGSGRWFAAPCETDCMGVAYRRDWFEDQQERSAFRARYGYELGPPDTWERFRDVAEFFTRPDQNRYGCSIPSGRQYDSLTMGFQQVLWAFGGQWSDPATKKVRGFLDVPGSADAIRFFGELLTFAPRGASDYDYGKVLEVFENGQVAMSVNYFAFFPGIVQNMGAKAGFAMVPRKGERRAISLGGQGLSISTRIPPARQELAKRFIAWFLERETQEKWIQKPAGFTADTRILSSAAFRAASPYNAAFADSIPHMRDFWNVPVFNELMAAAQQRVGEALDGVRSPEDALRMLAEEHERILRDAGELR